MSEASNEFSKVYNFFYCFKIRVKQILANKLKFGLLNEFWLHVYVYWRNIRKNQNVSLMAHTHLYESAFNLYVGIYSWKLAKKHS